MIVFGQEMLVWNCLPKHLTQAPEPEQTNDISLHCDADGWEALMQLLVVICLFFKALAMTPASSVVTESEY